MRKSRASPANHGHYKLSATLVTLLLFLQSLYYIRGFLVFLLNAYSITIYGDC